MSPTDSIFNVNALTRRDALRPLAAAGLAALVGSSAQAQSFPSRNITVVLPGSPGGPSDQLGRQFANSLAAQSGVAVVPENKPGANGIIGVQAVLNARPDGHTMLFTTMSTMAVNKALIKALPYEPLTDLTTLAVGYRTWLYVLISSRLPYKTMGELVEAAKKEPGKLNYGYGTSIPQMAGKLLEARSGAKFTFVPYKAHQAAVKALVAGEVDISITDPVSFGGFVKSGHLRLLGASSPTRMPGFTDVPLLSEVGVPNYTLGSCHVIMVKAGTPPDVVARLTEMLQSASRSPELQAFLANNHLDNFFATGAEAQRYLAGEIDNWVGIARNAGLQPV